MRRELIGLVVLNLWIALTCSQPGIEFPIGHLMPLGSHRPPTVEIDEFTIETAPRPQQFFEEYVKPSKAALFRGAMKNTKAFKTWTDEYMREKFGELEVRLEAKKEKTENTPIGVEHIGRDTIQHFIDTYREPDAWNYIVSELPVAMYPDVGVLPSLGACGEMAKRFVEIDIWWSGGGSQSIIHKDAFNQINCLYRGAKHWKLFEYKYEKWIYKHWEPENEVGGFSEVNVNAVDLHQHSDFAKVPWSNFTMHVGDCLFLPKSYYHQVNSDGPNNLAVSILFGRLDGKESIDVSDCNEKTDYKVPRPLSDLDVMWKWAGKGFMSMGRGDFEEGYRPQLKSLAVELSTVGQLVTPDSLEEIFGSGGEDDGKLREGNYTKAIAALDVNGDGSLSVSEIESATWDQLRNFGNEVEPHEPSNGYDFEYSLISYEVVVDLLAKVLNRLPTLTRKSWVRLYTRIAHGTETFANKIFTGLTGSDDIDHVISADVTEEDINRALEKWIHYWAPQYSSLEKRPSATKGDEEEEEDENFDEQEESVYGGFQDKEEL